MTPLPLDTNWYVGKLSALRDSLLYLFPCSLVTDITDKSELKALRKPVGASHPFAIVDGHDLYLLVYPGTLKGAPCAAVRVARTVTPSDEDVRIARAFCNVFNTDLRWSGSNSRRHIRLWQALHSTQFVRAIARFVAGSREENSDQSVRRENAFQRWLRAVEGMLTLTYEGQSARPSIVFYRTEARAGKRLGENLVQFREPISVADIFKDKWIRGMIEGCRVALVGDLETDHIIGLTSPETIDESESSHAPPRYAPHISLRLIQGILGQSGLALMTSAQGDLFVLTPGDVVFHKTQGRWRYLNYATAHNSLKEVLANEKVIVLLLRMALDLSYERKGALLAIFLESRGSLGEMIPDYESDAYANSTLRDAMRHECWIEDPSQRRLIIAAATVDGAVVIDRHGQVLDVACMIGAPSVKLMKMHGVAPPVDAGARTGAAWAASLFGASVKISEDGPISIYIRGKKVAAIG